MGKELTIAQLTFVDLYDSYTLSLSSDVIAVPCDAEGDALNTKTYTIDYQVRAGEEVVKSKCTEARLSTTINNVAVNYNTAGTISVTVNATARIPEDSGINITVVTDDSNEFAFNRFISFMNIKSGQDGKSIESVTEYYAATSTNTKPGNNEWATTIPSKYGKDYPYLWNYSSIGYSSGNPDSSEAQIIAYWGQDGGTGKGISRIEEWYATNNSPDTPPDDATGGWTTSLKVPTSDERYLWNYEKIYYTEGNPVPTNKRVIGVHGENGESAFVLKVVPDKGSVFKEGIEEIKLSLEAYEGTNKINEAVPYEWSYYNFERDEWKMVGDASEPQEMTGVNTVSVSQVSKSSNVFNPTLGADNYWVINMNKQHSSYSLIKLTYTITRTTEIILYCISDGEPNYDYMMVSEAWSNETDRKLSESSSVTSSDEARAVYNFKGKPSATPVAVSLGTHAPGTYYVYIKVRKDGSDYASYADTFKFKCMEKMQTADLIENISLTVRKSDEYAYSMFRCQITYNGTTYSDYETLKKDAHDVYHAEMEILDDGRSDTGQYAILYTKLYKNGKEVDPLKTYNVCYLRSGNYSFSSSYNKQKVITSSDIDISDPTPGDYAYFILQSKAYYHYVGRAGELYGNNADFQYKYENGSFVDCNSTSGLSSNTHLYAENFGCQIILCKYTSNYEWEMCDPNYEYSYENSVYENVTLQYSKILLLNKINFPSDLNLIVTVREKVIEDDNLNSSYPPFLCYTRGFETTTTSFSVSSDYGVQIKQNAKGEDVYLIDYNSLLYQVIKTSYIEECFSRDAGGVYVNQVVTEIDSDGKLVETKPFYVKITSQKMSFGAREYNTDKTAVTKDTEMVYIGNNATNITNSVLEGKTTINGDITISNTAKHATSKFGIQIENNGSISLVLA